MLDWFLRNTAPFLIKKIQNLKYTDKRETDMTFYKKSSDLMDLNKIIANFDQDHLAYVRVYV